MTSIRKEELDQLVTEENIITYREYENVTTPADLEEVHDLYHHLVKAHNAALALQVRGIDPEGTLEDMLSGTGDAIDAIANVLNPTGETLLTSEALIEIPDSLMNRAYHPGEFK